jgi:hypothetical protein
MGQKSFGRVSARSQWLAVVIAQSPQRLTTALPSISLARPVVSLLRWSLQTSRVARQNLFMDVSSRQLTFAVFPPAGSRPHAGPAVWRGAKEMGPL